ncbi:hypothetical protein L1987_54715 [Smallanthus sonchifolius]|uniref:Uncharacterized protein n=1 Tax=Smallanthus sonchifolius TaxID=185202 RepID=A0ACB9E8K2_9ASTR|nr:hypothetical protein L1987_54715 [Smallanthus sonchifolius]
MGNGMSLEDTVTKLIPTTESQALLADSCHKQYEERFSLHEAEFKTQKATLQSIETRLGQIEKKLSERQPGCLPSNTETNPKANVSAITLRNSKVYLEPPIPGEEIQSPRREIFTGVPLRPQPANPGKFSLPCSIRPLPVTYAPADLGPNVNVMPSTMFQKLDIGQPRPVNETIELADGSVKTPIGVIENLLEKVGKFVFPVDFMVLEMGQDFSVPLILGRPFLATARVVIDMNEGILTLRRITSPDYLSTLRSYTPTLRAWSRKPHQISEKFDKVFEATC